MWFWYQKSICIWRELNSFKKNSSESSLQAKNIQWSKKLVVAQFLNNKTFMIQKQQNNLEQKIINLSWINIFVLTQRTTDNTMMMSFDIKMPDVYRSRCNVCFSNVQGTKKTLYFTSIEIWRQKQFRTKPYCRNMSTLLKLWISVQVSVFGTMKS